MFSFLLMCSGIIYKIYCKNLYFTLSISKLGVPIKTTVSATVLEEALNGAVTIRPLPLGQPLCRKVQSCALSFLVSNTSLAFVHKD